MTHVFRVEPVVSEFVHNYLICREIVCRSWIGAYGLVGTQQKCGFAELIAVCPVLEMSDGADSEDEFLAAELYYAVQ